jgi:hypothetical protein
VANFFISYTSADRQWAEWIAWQLEKARFSVIIQAWDFVPGSNFVLEMQRATESERTILILSPSFLTSSFTKSEWAVAFGKDPEGLKRKIVPIRVLECEPTGLLASIVYIDLVGLDEPRAVDRLLQYLSAQRLKPSSSPVFPAKRIEFPVASNTTLSALAGGGAASSSQRRFVHAQIGTTSPFEVRPGSNPYASMSDPTDDRVDASPSMVQAFVFFPHPDYFRTALKPYTPAAAVCTTDSSSLLVKLRDSVGEHRLDKLNSSPSAWMNEDKEAIVKAVCAAADTSFIAAVTVPAFVLSHAREKPHTAYDALSNLFLLPLLGMHRSLGIRDFQITFSPVGGSGADLIAASKRTLKAAYTGRRTFKTEIASGDDCLLCGVARLVAYAVGLHYNANSDKWIRILEESL